MNRLLAALLCAMLAVSAYAGTELQWGKANRVPQTGTVRVAPINAPVVGGVARTDTSGVPFQFDANGNAYFTDADRDRDYSVLQNILTSANINAGGSVRSSVKSLTAYGKGTLLLTYGVATAADSDSVNIAVTISALTSSSSGNRYNLATTLATTGVDTSWAYSSTGFQVMKPMPTYYITRNSLQFLSISGSLSANPVRFPLSIYRLGASTNGIAIPLADLTGAAFPVQYVEVVVSNLHPRKNLTSVQLDYWPRVN